MNEFPLWFWIVLGVMNVFSLLWMLLILRDVRHEFRSQKWIVGELNREIFQLKRLAFYKMAYVLATLILSALSVLLIPVIL